MHILDASLFVLLLVGNILALPLWWGLFGAPVVRLWKRYFAEKRSSATLSSNRAKFPRRQWKGERLLACRSATKEPDAQTRRRAYALWDAHRH